MLENIAMWGGIAGIVIAIFAVIVLFLTRQSIVNILNKDKILFDQNFEIKQKAVSSALACVDELNEKGGVIKSTPEFSAKAKHIYNELLCVLSDVRIADEFYNIAIDLNSPYNEARVAQFKLMCRKDIGLNVNKALTVKRVLAQQKLQSQQSYVQPVQPQIVQQPTQPMQEPVNQFVQTQQQYTQPAQSIQQTQPVQRVVQQARPIQAQRPSTQPITRPVQPVRRVQPANMDKPNGNSNV
ncbi:MAG: hypothetical protein IJW36_00735 [Clostridia bacterium]|nr:hypothetical protein [Clostridia bacterium]